MGDENLADVLRQWREALFSDLPWEMDPEPPDVHHEGASGGYFVRADDFGHRGFLKPTDRFPDHTPWPTVEKICSDIGLEVGMPVSPVLLHRRTDARENDEDRTCVSLVMHDRFSDWPPNGRPKVPQRADLAAILGAASGIVALDTYLGNVDRSDHRPNAVFYQPSGRAEETYVVFIDFANCLNRQDRWMKGGWNGVSVPNMPRLLREAVRTDVLFEAVERIEGLSDDTIDGVVGRIPPDYLTGERKQVVAQALKDRRALIRPILELEFSPSELA